MANAQVSGNKDQSTALTDTDGSGLPIGKHWFWLLLPITCPLRGAQFFPV